MCQAFIADLTILRWLRLVTMCVLRIRVATRLAGNVHLKAHYVTLFYNCYIMVNI